MNTKRFRKLKELAVSIRAGKQNKSKEYFGKGEIRVIKSRNISNGILTESVNDYFISSEENLNDSIELGDILVSLIGPEFNSCVIESLILTCRC